MDRLRDIIGVWLGYLLVRLFARFLKAAPLLFVTVTLVTVNSASAAGHQAVSPETEPLGVLEARAGLDALARAGRFAKSVLSGYDFASDGAVAARGIGSLDDLSRAAGALDRGGLSAAGRQLQKHGSRPGSAFPGARGNPSAINQQGQQIVDDILTTPGTTTVSRHHARFGDVTEIRAPDGRGLRYGSDGRFLGFLEPRP